MSSLWEALTKRSSPALSLDDWVQAFSFGGLNYPFVPSQTMPGDPPKEMGGDFRGFIEGIYKQNGVVFACMAVRQLLFSEARFQFRQLRNGRPGDLFGTAALAPLETPEPGRTTGDLLSHAITDADLAGNWYGLRTKEGYRRLRPDWVQIILGSPDGGPLADMELAGYTYQPGGPAGGQSPIAFMPDEVAHFAPIPDPSARFRGMSWLTPVISDILGDQAGQSHKTKFYENAATPNMVVQFDPAVDQSAVAAYVQAFREGHEGAANAYKTLFLGGGADAKVVGSNFQQLEFKETQAYGETRIAAAAGVPPVIAGLSEGLSNATYSNYSQARRRFADGTMRPLWRNMAGSLAPTIAVPSASELWYDDRDIPFLQEDLKDRADTQQVQATAMKSLVEAGFTPESVRDAIMADDWSRLDHSGLTSVQLLPPGTSKNGNSNGSDPAEPATGTSGTNEGA